MEIKWTSLSGLIAGILKSNFGQGPVIVHSDVNRRQQKKVEIDLQGSVLEDIINSMIQTSAKLRLLCKDLVEDLKREDERGLSKGCSINQVFSEKGDQKVWWAHPSSHAGHISTRETFRLKGVRARPGLCVTFGSELHLLSAPLSLYIFIWREIRLTSLSGLIAAILKSNFGQRPVIVHSGVN
ncbi:hypothetical protein CDAR_184431 [Caerostris darwini]|uniref:Uncharacterized protein n=1 Tax=Caerostris darwini TaxID=1538125 RepID=A0AAV4UG60_9ARAC|nr:hypothetical protein CDAR_184431 [Caerostris darwini]